MQVRLLRVTLVALCAGLSGADHAAAQQDSGSGAGGAVPKASGQALPKTEAEQGPKGAQNTQVKAVGKFGDWTLLCTTVKNASGEKPCSLAKALVESETQKLAFRLIFALGPKRDLVLQVDGPTGVALQRGLEFSPDTKKVYRLPFQTCVPMGCRAVMVVEKDLRDELTASKKGSITVYALDGRAVKTTTDLSGLSDGFAALNKHHARK